MSQLNFNKLVADTAKQITGLLAPAKAPPAAKGKLPKAAPAKPVKAAPAKPKVVRGPRSSPEVVKTLRTAILLSLKGAKFGRGIGLLLPEMPAGTTKLALAHQLKQLKALGQVEQIGERKLARYRRAVAKKG